MLIVMGESVVLDAKAECRIRQRRLRTIVRVIDERTLTFFGGRDSVVLRWPNAFNYSKHVQAQAARLALLSNIVRRDGVSGKKACEVGASYFVASRYCLRISGYAFLNFKFPFGTSMLN